MLGDVALLCDCQRSRITLNYSLLQVNLDNVMDVIIASDMLLVPGLKRQCGVYLGTQLNSDNVIIVLRLARMFELPRLEDQCIAFMAKNLELVSYDILRRNKTLYIFLVFFRLNKRNLFIFVDKENSQVFTQTKEKISSSAAAYR